MGAGADKVNRPDASSLVEVLMYPKPDTADLLAQLMPAPEDRGAWWDRFYASDLPERETMTRQLLHDWARTSDAIVVKLTWTEETTYVGFILVNPQEVLSWMVESHCAPAIGHKDLWEFLQSEADTNEWRRHVFNDGPFTGPDVELDSAEQVVP